MNNMNASIDIAGSAQSPSIKITSDVDDKMKRLLADQFKQQKQKFEKRLKAALNKKASNMLKDSDKLSTLFNQEQIELNQLDDQLSGLLNQNIDNISTKQQKNIEDKLKKQLQKWF